MTRRGSLIYYLTAWICGCFFMSLAIWIRDFWGSTVTSPRSHEAFGILFFYFYGLVFRRACGFDRRVLASSNHDAAEMQDSAALGRRSRRFLRRCSWRLWANGECARLPGSE